MKRGFKYLLLMVMTAQFSCKKDRFCVCPSDPPRGDDDLVLIHDTKKNFEEKCGSMKNPHGSGPCFIPK